MNRKIIITLTILICLFAAVITAQHFTNAQKEESTAQAVLTGGEDTLPSDGKTETAVSESETQKPAETQTAKPSYKDTQASRAEEKPATEKLTTAKTTAAKPTAAATARTSQKPTKPTAAQSSTEKQTFTVTFSINAEKALDYGKELPNGGYILPPMKISAKKGETVFDLLEKICGEKGISLKYQTKSYIREIGGLAEKDCGPGSGWMYRINGEKPPKPASKYEISDGDIIEWYYVTSQND